MGGRTEPELERCDKIYLFHWDRNGILYGTDKGRQLQSLIQQRTANIQPPRGSQDSKAWDTYHAEENRITEAMEALTHSPADPERFPPLPPPTRHVAPRRLTKIQTTNAWDNL